MSSPRSHWRPRTARGWFALVAFVGGLVLAQPPVVFAFANRISPWILGMPFLYAYLSVVYLWLIGVLLVVWRWRL
ncbi:MAG: hypothetical protein GKS06_01535 [Acidobacteria bacterium]|nr:hypothetical protein [Acidobacteriota bacterium]